MSSGATQTMFCASAHAGLLAEPCCNATQGACPAQHPKLCYQVGDLSTRQALSCRLQTTLGTGPDPTFNPIARWAACRPTRRSCAAWPRTRRLRRLSWTPRSSRGTARSSRPCLIWRRRSLRWRCWPRTRCVFMRCACAGIAYILVRGEACAALRYGRTQHAGALKPGHVSRKQFDMPVKHIWIDRACCERAQIFHLLDLGFQLCAIASAKGPRLSDMHVTPSSVCPAT